MATKIELARARKGARNAREELRTAIVHIPVGTALAFGAQTAFPAMLASNAAGIASAVTLGLSIWKDYPGRYAVIGVSLGLLGPHVQSLFIRLRNRIEAATPA